MNERVLGTSLSTDTRGSSVRVVVTADRYTVANISEGMNDREVYARLFAAAPDLLRALQTVRLMIQGQMIEAAVTDINTMRTLGEVVGSALAKAEGSGT